MPVLIGRIETENGAKYGAQLCRHFAHKIEASFDGDSGRAAFVYGPAIMDADVSGLTVRFDVADPADVEDAKSVIDSHLAKFAFREKISGMVWRHE